MKGASLSRGLTARMRRRTRCIRRRRFLNSSPRSAPCGSSKAARLPLSDVWQGFTSIFIHRDTLREVLTRQTGGPYGLGAAVAGDGASLFLMKRGQNVGYQGHLILYQPQNGLNPTLC